MSAPSLTVGIYTRRLPQAYEPHVSDILSRLKEHGVACVIYHKSTDLIRLAKMIDLKHTTYTDEDSLKKLDYFIAMGGDGTILRTTTRVAAKGVPIVSLNTGRLGFLSQADIRDFETHIDCFFSGEFSISTYDMLKLEIIDGVNKQIKANFALNEISLHNQNLGAVMKLEVMIDDQPLSSYWADGLIVATPVGSTAYSLSCGGPIIDSHLPNWVITPIAPHNLTTRPVVISNEKTLTIKVDQRNENFKIGLDGRIYTLPKSATIRITKNPFPLKTVEFGTMNFFDIVRQKLGWGYDLRNN